MIKWIYTREDIQRFSGIEYTLYFISLSLFVPYFVSIIPFYSLILTKTAITLSWQLWHTQTPPCHSIQRLYKNWWRNTKIWTFPTHNTNVLHVNLATSKWWYLYFISLILKIKRVIEVGFPFYTQKYNYDLPP